MRWLLGETERNLSLGQNLERLEPRLAHNNMNSGQSRAGATLTVDSPSVFYLSQALSAGTCGWQRWRECLRSRAHTAELCVRGTGCAVEPNSLAGGQEEAAAWRKWPTGGHRPRQTPGCEWKPRNTA